MAFLERETYNDFEIIVSDNYTNPALSCETYCRKSLLKNIKYVRPPAPLGMVANWNYALQYATGDYVCFFTDKMFLLPGTLAYVAEILQKNPTEILNWVDSKFTPLKFPDYFGMGDYVRGVSEISPNKHFEEFDPKEELRKKAFATVSRHEQGSSHYVRGKICFGAYDRHLITRIMENTGQLFYNVSPDYTSMILGLSYANSAMEINRPGIVHINTDLSNGGQSNIRDEHALSYLNSLSESEQLFEEMLVPYLYSSPHNIVARDYVSLKHRFDLKYELNRINWLVYVTEDLDISGRIWSSPQIAQKHRELLACFVNEKLNESEREQYFSRLKQRLPVEETTAMRRTAIKNKVKVLLRQLIPEFALEMRRKYHGPEQRTRPTSVRLRLQDLLERDKY